MRAQIVGNVELAVEIEYRKLSPSISTFSAAPGATSAVLQSSIRFAAAEDICKALN